MSSAVQFTKYDTLEEYIGCSFPEIRRHPIKPHQNPIACERARILDKPRPIPKLMHLQSLGNFRFGQGVGQIALVCIDEDNRIEHLSIVRDFVQFVSGFFNSFMVAAIDDKYEPVRASKVMSPQGPNFFLTANIPNVKHDVAVFHGLHIESHGWDSRDSLSKLEFVQDCGFSR